MSNHPNRGPKGPSSNPTPEEVRAAREAAGLSQTAAAGLIYCTLRAWQGWEATAGDSRRPMHPAFFDLFKRKVAEL
jgi:DNA-binding transcriptional regulator YiaG